MFIVIFLQLFCRLDVFKIKLERSLQLLYEGRVKGARGVRQAWEVLG